MSERNVTYAIGDIHGCLKELQALYYEIKWDAKTIVFLGDYVDRGPNSAGVIKFLMGLDNTEINHVFLMGNHEDMMINDYNPQEGVFEDNPPPDAYSMWMANGGVETWNSYNEQYKTIPNHHLEWLKGLKSIYQQDEYVFVHAGIDPLKDIKDQSLTTKLWSRAFVGYGGEYLHGGYVIHGHTPQTTMMNIKTNKTINLDTGCCFGLGLTALRIDENKHMTTITCKKFSLEISKEVLNG